MKPEDLAEAVGLYARYVKRRELKLKAWEVWMIVNRLIELGVKMP